MTVYPPRNLPGDAVEWGRHLESRVESLKTQWGVLAGSVNITERSTGGQLGVLEGITDELLLRNTEVIRAPNMTVSGAVSPGVNPRTLQTVTFSPAPGGRTGFLTVSGVPTRTAGDTSNVTLFVRQSGTRLLRLEALPYGYADSDPIESRNRGQFSGFCRIQLPSNAPVPILLDFVKVSGGASTLTLEDISLSLTRSESA